MMNNLSIKKIVEQTLVALAVIVIIALVTLIVGLITKSVTITLTVALIILFLISIVLAYKHKNRFRQTVWIEGLFIVILFGAYVGLRQYSPWCNPKQMVLKVVSIETGERLPIRHDEVHTEPDMKLEVSAALFETSPNSYQCEWTYLGEGSVLQKELCKLLIKSGTDDVPDLISISVSRTDCSRHIFEAIHILSDQE